MNNIFKSQNKNVKNLENFSTTTSVEYVEGKNNADIGDATHIRIPDGTETIDEAAFARNENIISVIIPDSVKELTILLFTSV